MAGFTKPDLVWVYCDSGTILLVNSCPATTCTSYSLRILLGGYGGDHETRIECGEREVSVGS